MFTLYINYFNGNEKKNYYETFEEAKADANAYIVDIEVAFVVVEQDGVTLYEIFN